MIDHVSLEVSDLERSARFYDALFFAVGVRRMLESDEAIAYGIDHRSFWIRHAPDAALHGGHVAIAARGRVAVDAAHEAGLGAGGSDDGPPGPRPRHGPRYYAGYLRDPDGLRVEIVTGSGG
jgi:catechol 2,3-dioxygenase-like lactoylglutathione lyase family enzyme